MLHRFPNEDGFSHRIHLAELGYVTSFAGGFDFAGGELCWPAV